MAGMRDRLIHGYDTVDLDVLWKTVTEALPTTRLLIAEVIRHEQAAADASSDPLASPPL